ncbi:hypothetical protein FQN60_000229 [Etheostoma spectabile]|uniref:Sperm antigen with calponin homology and coiled-coil domains 1 n=1 Tax=Etheostoma spectabile TaxID=54343 RepID=A0A5J5CZQ7_9PERO|nr:hypothetical protein FQN60_000229 [Etheostoma spectabile]
MMKSGATKVGLPKLGLQDRAKQASFAPSSSTTNSTSTAMKTSRSSNTLASDQRLSKLKRASSDDALTKPALGATASGSRMKKTVTMGAISDLPEARPRSLSAQTPDSAVTCGPSGARSVCRSVFRRREEREPRILGLVRPGVESGSRGADQHGEPGGETGGNRVSIVLGRKQIAHCAVMMQLTIQANLCSVSVAVMEPHFCLSSTRRNIKQAMILLSVLTPGIQTGVISVCTSSSCGDVMVKEVGDLKMSEFMCSIWVLFTKSKRKTEYEGTANERLSYSPTPGAQAAKKSGIPAPREISSTITRDRISLRDQLRSSTTKRMVSSASTSSLSTLAKQTRSVTKSRGDAEGQEKGVLECQVKELLAEAKAKDLEISNLRMELQRCKGKASTASSLPSPNTVSWQEPAADGEQGQVAEALVLVGELREKNGKFQRELAALREENQALKEKLLCLEASPLSSSNTSSPSKPLVNGLTQQDSVPSTARPLKTSVSSSSDVTKDSPSPDSSEFEKIPSRSESESSGVSGEAVVVGTRGRDVSVQSLTEQIHKMEESHHSTAEELQATLQELADQQQVVQELTAENERLAEEKRLLQTSLQQQRERLEVQAQKNEALSGRLHEQAQAQAQREEELSSQGPRLAELEQREEMDRLQAQLDRELQAGGQAAQAAEEQRATADSLRLENSRLKAQVDIERQKVGELKAMQSASDSTEMQNLLKTAHSEKDRLEVELTELRQEVLQAQAETEHVRSTMSKVEAKCQQVQERAERREQELSSRVTSLEEAGSHAENQVKELKETIFELEDQVEQQRAVNCHTNQAVLDMENLVKKLEEQKIEADRQLKVLGRQMKDEKEEWRRFQADLQTAVVVANDIKVEAQQELRTLRRQLQEEQDRSAKLSSDLEALQGVRISSGATFDTKTAVEGH